MKCSRLLAGVLDCSAQVPSCFLWVISTNASCKDLCQYRPIVDCKMTVASSKGESRESYSILPKKTESAIIGSTLWWAHYNWINGL